MPNANYVRGRAFEYKRKKVWEGQGFKVIRASGSHGEYDLITYEPSQKPCFIQCKIVETEADANRLLKEFQSHTVSASHYHQRIEIWVSKLRELRGCVI